MNNKKPVITKIKFSKEEQEEIDLINKGEMIPNIKTRIDKFGNTHEMVYQRRFTFSGATMRLRELYGGGFCTTCRALPIYKVSYDVGDANQGAWLVQRYCQPCFDKWNNGKWKKKKKN